MKYLPLPSEFISELFAEVSNTGKMDPLDYQMLRDAILSSAMSDEEKQAIDRLLYAVRLGRIQVTEDPHA